jgi:hypothetical protein
MIKITRGNPTPEEIAALVAVLTLGNGATKRRITSSAAGEWRRSTPFDEVNPAALSGRGRRWRRIINRKNSIGRMGKRIPLVAHRLMLSWEWNTNGTKR